MPAPLLIERAAATKAARETAQGRLAQAVFAIPSVKTDIEVLGKRGAQLQAAQLLSHSPQRLVEEVLRLKDDVTRARGAGAAVLSHEEVLQRIRSAVRQYALPCLRRTDWKGHSKPEHVGLVYIILLTIMAADIYRECVRVLVKGEAVSQMFHEQLGDGYKIFLSQVSF